MAALSAKFYALLGIRESRRITCDYRMTRADFIARRHHPDDIGAFSYPIDIHESEPTKEANERFEKDLNTMVYAPGEHYGIPYRALMPVGLKNVLVAGRSICTDRSMLSSIRVMPCCFITGQAIGMAAAMAPEDVHSLDVPPLQARPSARFCIRRAQKPERKNTNERQAICFHYRAVSALAAS